MFFLFFKRERKKMFSLRCYQGSPHHKNVEIGKFEPSMENEFCHVHYIKTKLDDNIDSLQIYPYNPSKECFYNLLTGYILFVYIKTSGEWELSAQTSFKDDYLYFKPCPNTTIIMCILAKSKEEAEIHLK